MDFNRREALTLGSFMFALSLSGGALVRPAGAMASPSPASGPFAERGMRTLYNGARVAAPGEVRQVLRDMVGPGAPSSDRGLIRAARQLVEQCAETVVRLRGFGGLVTYALISGANASLPANENRPNMRPFGIEVTGRIDETGRDGGPGFLMEPDASDPSIRHGHIWVTMTFRFVSAGGGGDPEVYGSFAYSLKAVATDRPGRGRPTGRFRVIPRDETGSSAFPGAAIFISQQEASDRNFRYKLEATAARGLHVGEVWVEENGGGFVRLSDDPTCPGSLPASLGWHVMRDPLETDACIDMMFGPAPDGERLWPPVRLPEGLAPPDYCLGRCASPYLVNTY